MGLNSMIYGPNIGEFETTMPVNKTQTTYRSDDCKINLNFAFDPKQGQQVILNRTMAVQVVALDIMSMQMGVI